MVPILIQAVGLGALLYLLHLLRKVGRLFFLRFSSPLRHLPGPPNDHWFFGNLKTIAQAETPVTQEKWMEQYGPTMAYTGIFGVRILKKVLPDLIIVGSDLLIGIVIDLPLNRCIVYGPWI